MKRSAIHSVAGALALCAGLLALAPSASAQVWPNGAGDNRDHVTGYLCTTSYCDTLRLPTTDCICTKQNPTEMDFRKLRLKCFASEGGKWVACPVQPRPGELPPFRR